MHAFKSVLKNCQFQFHQEGEIQFLTLSAKC